MSPASKETFAASRTGRGVSKSGSPMVSVLAPGMDRAKAVKRRMPEVSTPITALFKVSSMCLTLLFSLSSISGGWADVNNTAQI